MKRLIFKVTSIIISLVLLLSTTSICATQQELNEKINKEKEKLNDVQEEKSGALQEVENLTTKIDEYQTQINQLDNQISNLNIKINESQQKLDEAQKEYTKQEELLNARLVATYMAGETSYLDFLLTSSNITDLISNYYLVSEIAETDMGLLEKIENQKQEIEKAKKELESSKQELSTSKASKQSVTTQLQTAKNEKNAQVANLSEEEKNIQKTIEQYEAEQEKMRVLAQKAAQQAAAGNTSGGSNVVHNGQMKWPCPSYSYISSYFGGRASPGGVGSTNHKAIDLAAPHGSSILAAGAGTVIYVSNTCGHDYPKSSGNNCSCGGGFGNYIQISHGNGLVTVYAHCSAIYVSTGQAVSAGQQIGAVGCTGHSTGNHLHFGMLRNGSYVDPLPYIQ